MKNVNETEITFDVTFGSTPRDIIRACLYDSLDRIVDAIRDQAPQGAQIKVLMGVMLEGENGSDLASVSAEIDGIGNPEDIFAFFNHKTEEIA